MKKFLSLMLCFSLIASVLMLSLTGCAQQDGPRVISEDTTFSQDTAFDQDVTINEGVTVTVEAGATLTFGENTKATVNGNIVVNGNVDVRGDLTLQDTAITWETLAQNGAYRFYTGADLFVGDQHIVGEEGDFTADVQVGNGTWATQVADAPVLISAKDGVSVAGKVYLNATLEDTRTWNLGLDGVVVLYKDNALQFETEQDTNGGSYAVVCTYGGMNTGENCNFSVLNQNYFRNGDAWTYYSYDVSNPAALVGLIAYAGKIDAKNQQDRGGLQTWNGNTIYGTTGGIDGQILKDLKYTTSRGGTRNTYDLWLPKYISERENQGKDVPVIVFLHGGSWTSGTKEEMNQHCAMYAKKGYVTATVNYRLFAQPDPEDSGHFLDMINDIYKAVASIKAQLEKLGYTATTMAISGQSAGGHLAMLYAATYGEDSPIPVKLVLNEWGPTDFSPEAWANANILWAVEKWGDYNKVYKTLEEDPFWEEKIYHAVGFSAGILSTCEFDVGVDADGVLSEEYRAKYMSEYQDKDSETYQQLASISPVLLWENCKIPLVGIHGEMDPIVSVVNAQRMKAELERLGVDHYYIIAPVNSHSGGGDTTGYATYFVKSQEYLDKYLKSAN